MDQGHIICGLVIMLRDKFGPLWSCRVGLRIDNDRVDEHYKLLQPPLWLSVLCTGAHWALCIMHIKDILPVVFDGEEWQSILVAI